MKRKFLKFENIQNTFEPDMIGRNRAPRMFRFGMPRMNYDAGSGGGGGAATPPVETEAEKTAKAALLLKVQALVKTEVEAGKFANAESVRQAFTELMGDANLAALEKLGAPENVVALQQSVKRMADAITKLQGQAANLNNATEGKKQAIRTLLADEKVMKRIEQAFNNTDGSTTVTLNVQAAVAAMTTGNTIDYSAVAIPEDILESFSVDGFVKKRRAKEYIYDIASRRTVAKIAEYKTWLEEGDEQGAFALIVEGQLKPLVSKTLVRNLSKYKKVAGKRVYTEEFKMFREEAYNILEDLFNDQLLRNYAAILTTNLLAVAAGYVGTTLDGQYTNPTDYHAIGAVAAQIETLEFEPDLLILNPQDKWRIGLQQAGDGHFFINIPQLNPQTGVVTMLGFRVFTTSRMAAGSFILGESGLFKIEDMPVSVRLGYGINVVKDGANVTEVESDVDHNRFRIIAETWFHNYIATNNLGSFVMADFDDVKEALTAPGV